MIIAQLLPGRGGEELLESDEIVDTCHGKNSVNHPVIQLHGQPAVTQKCKPVEATHTFQMVFMLTMFNLILGLSRTTLSVDCQDKHDKYATGRKLRAKTNATFAT